MINPSTLPCQKNKIADKLSISLVNIYDKFLGLPITIPDPSNKPLILSKNRIALKCAGWKEQQLSKRGKEILIKTITSAIPVYAMSCFRLPVSLCKEVNGIVSQLWWGQKQNEKKLHLVLQSKMCDRKSEGGLGFKDLESFNKVLVAKHGWQILSQPNSLLGRILKEKYFPLSSFLSIVQGRECFGDGKAFSEVESLFRCKILCR